MTRPGGTGSVLAAIASAVGWSALAGVLLATAGIVPYGGVGLVAIAPLLRRGAPPGPRLGPVARPLSALIGAPALLVMPALMAHDPVVRSLWRCGTAAAAAVVMLPIVTFFAGVIAGAGAVGVSAVAPRLVARAAVPLRAAALLVAVVLLVAGSLRAVRRPAAEAWAHHLPVTARAEVPSGSVCEPVLGPFELPQGSRTLLVECDARVRHVTLGGPDGRALIDGASIHRLVVDGAPLALRAHQGLGVVVLTQADRVVGAVDARSGRLVDVTLRAVANEVAPPALSLAAAAAGLCVGLARMRRAARERAAALLVARGEPANVDETGLVTPEGGGDVFRPPGAALPSGPAVVLGRPQALPFRAGADRGTWVLPGARETHLEEHRAHAVAYELEATAAIVVAGAPLVTAALLGLVL